MQEQTKSKNLALNRSSLRLLVNSNFFDQELIELESLIVDYKIPVERYFIKSVDNQEIIRLVFTGSIPIVFLKSYIIGKIMDAAIAQIIGFIKKKKPSASSQIGFNLLVKDQDKNFSLNISYPIREGQIFREKLEIFFSSIDMSTIKDSEILSIGFDDEKKQIQILKIKNEN